MTSGIFQHHARSVNAAICDGCGVLQFGYGLAVAPRKGNPMCRLTISDIERAVSTFYQLDITELRQKSSQRKNVRPRQVAFYIAREATKASLPQIGRHFSRHHTTVLHGVRVIERLSFEDWDLQHQLDAVRELVAHIVPAFQRSRDLLAARPLVEVANV